MKLLWALFMCGYTLIFPAQAMAHAREAMALWAEKVAPALFPFMALFPVLTGEEALRAYKRLFGRGMERVFNLPSDFSAAVAIGFMAGTPAGAMAAQRALSDTDMRVPVRKVLALSLLASGASPVFLVCSVGNGMLESAQKGLCMLICLWLSACIAAFITARLPVFPENYERVTVKGKNVHEGSGIFNSVSAVLNVCGYMVLFRVFTGWLPEWTRLFSEISSGCAFAAENGREWLCAFACGFTGACAMTQNLAYYRFKARAALMFVLLKAASALLAAGLYSAFCRIPINWKEAVSKDTLYLGTCLALGLAAMICGYMLISIAKGAYYLRKAKNGKAYD
ncbi:MAG: hypothetical protein IJC48_06865 [Clostridia bacterium]|nr:hypothetical protein [Clostridia bacterium]